MFALIGKTSLITRHSQPTAINAQRPNNVVCKASIMKPKLTSLQPKLFVATAAVRRRNVNSVVVCAGRNSQPDIPDRVIGALPYLLPLFDGLRYGKFVFMQFPAFANLLLPLQPLLNLYFSVPFASIAIFFAVYLGIINNQSLSRFTRFNAMQAVLLDIILILPGLFESVLNIRPSGGVGLQLYITLYNTIFLFLFACVTIGIGSCMAGKSARLPLVSDAADAQVP